MYELISILAGIGAGLVAWRYGTLPPLPPTSALSTASEVADLATPPPIENRPWTSAAESARL